MSIHQFFCQYPLINYLGVSYDEINNAIFDVLVRKLPNFSISDASFVHAGNGNAGSAYDTHYFSVIWRLS